VPLRISMRVQNVCFGLGVLGMAVGTIVMFATSRSTFASHFDKYGGAGSYNHVLDAAAKAHIAAPGTSWGNTFPAIAVTASVLVYTWWSVAYAGEIRQARTWKTLQTMTVSLGTFVLLLTIPTLALYHMVGSHFLASANALSGTPDYPLSTSPVWYSLVGVAANSTALTVFLVVTFLLWFPLLMWLNLAPPLRGFFAWSFDGVLPRAVTYVSPRTHTPLVSLAINAVLSVFFILWAVYTTSFFTVLADGILMTMIPVLFVSAAAILLPWHRPGIWRQTPKSNVRIGGIPLITVLGVLGFLSASLIVYIFLRYAGLGVHNRSQTITMFLACLPVGYVIYQVARAAQRRRGVDITLHYAEIPPE
jgi:basic amino acid/polyamine antiporter, APA family